MRRPLAAMLVIALAALIFSVPASAIPIHKHVMVTRHRTSEFAAIHSPRAAAYTVRVEKVVKLDVPPPNADGDKLADSLDSCPNEFATTDDGCPPAPQPNVSSSGNFPVPAPAPAPSGGCPSYMSGEASSPTATNPSSGAYGCFQVLPSTGAALGCDLSTMAGQYDCRDKICATQGNGAWSASGATPCS